MILQACTGGGRNFYSTDNSRDHVNIENPTSRIGLMRLKCEPSQTDSFVVGSSVT